MRLRKSKEQREGFLYLNEVFGFQVDKDDNEFGLDIRGRFFGHDDVVESFQLLVRGQVGQTLC